MQPFERYKGGLIFYSLGNFVFDLDSTAAKESVAVKLFLIGNRLAAAELYPIWIERSCCARRADAEQAREILDRMHAPSTHVPLS